MRTGGLVAGAGAVVLLVAAAAWWLLVGQPQARERAARDAVEAYAAAWQDGDWPTLAALVRPPADRAVAGHRALVDDLEPERLRVVPASVTVDGDRGRAELGITVDLAGFDPWTWTSALDLVWEDRTWQVDWAPTAVRPAFVEGGRFARTRTLEPRAAIRDRHGVPLAGGAEVVAVGIEPRRIADREAVVDALVTHAGASRSRVEALLDRDDLVDDWYYPVVELPQERFDEVDAALRPVPGIVFRAGEGRGVPGGFALHVVGRTAELSAEEAAQRGRGYEAGDEAGAFGLERTYDERLAGRPAIAIRIVDATGSEIAVVNEVEPVTPEDVTVTLDRRVQEAAEAALDGVAEPAALVVVARGSMEVLASTSRPREGFNRAFAGRYPPGSTFKLVTTAALLGAGFGVESTFDCPATRSIGGRSFRNAGDRALGTITLREAFSESCNTAYVGTMPGLEDDLAAAARAFGFDGTGHDVVLDAVGGAYPDPDDLVEAAAAAIGQARVEASPLHMATVAAAAADGRWRPATLRPDAGRETREIPGDAAVLRALMREAVTTGTGSAAEVAGARVGGKTGSAEFGTGDPPETHAWFVGYHDDLAFAVLVEGGGAGGEVAAPIAARLVRALS